MEPDIYLEHRSTPRPSCHLILTALPRRRLYSPTVQVKLFKPRGGKRHARPTQPECWRRTQKPWGRAPTGWPTSLSGRPGRGDTEQQLPDRRGSSATKERVARRKTCSAPRRPKGGAREPLTTLSPRCLHFPAGPGIHPEVTLRPRRRFFTASPAPGVFRARGCAAGVRGVGESPRPSPTPPTLARCHSSYFLSEFGVRVNPCNCFEFRF